MRVHFDTPDNMTKTRIQFIINLSTIPSDFLTPIVSRAIAGQIKNLFVPKFCPHNLDRLEQNLSTSNKDNISLKDTFINAQKYNLNKILIQRYQSLKKNSNVNFFFQLEEDF